MSLPPELLPVLQITMPIVLAIFAAIWSQNKGFDSQNKRLDDIVRRLDAIEARLARIETILKEHGERITRLEERVPPLVHR